MQDSEPSVASPAPRPMGRPTVPPPVQRGNYGMPPRPMSRPTGQAPRFMDVSAPATPARPAPPQPAAAPAPPTPTPVVAAPAPVSPPNPQPVAAPEPAVQAPAPQTATQPPRPLFATAPEHQPQASAQSKKPHHLVPKIKTAVLVLAVLLSVLGIGRWVTAGSTSGQIIAVGAVAANDGRNMTIQFTANDGKIHKFTEGSDAAMIPGTAVQVAYRSGAPDASVKRVAVVQGARDMGRNLFLAGLFLAVVYGVMWVVQKARTQKAMTLTTPVTV